MLTPLYGSLSPLTISRATVAAAALGPELVSNGTFTGGSLAGWTQTTAEGIFVGNAPGGHANLVNGEAALAVVSTPFTTVSGQTYRATGRCKLSIYSGYAVFGISTAPDFSLGMTGIGEFSSTGSGTASLDFVATAATTYFLVGNYPSDDGEGGVNSSEFQFDDISVKQVL